MDPASCTNDVASPKDENLDGGGGAVFEPTSESREARVAQLRQQVREGTYEIRLEQEETVWAKREERDRALEILEAWQRGFETESDW